MYESFYGLNSKPFTILPDPDFLYWGRGHRLAYTMLEYGVASQAGITVITGEIGCGKTTLLRQLLEDQDHDITIGLLSNTHESATDLLSWILLAYDLPFEDGSKVAKFERFQQFLIDQYAQGKRTVLVVDEAQNLGPITLEELRVLTNINVGKDLLLQLVLVGQPQLKTLLQRPELVQFAQRVASDFNISPLGEAEIGEYIVARLEIAGRKHPLFEPAALPLIYEYSQGVPRLINILCDMCLVYGFSGGATSITKRIVSEVLKDKGEFGVFGSDGSRIARTNEDENFRPYEDDEKPALVINDRNLARSLLNFARDKLNANS